MKQYYDEFKGFTLDKMAQEIENLTYLYEETHVPKKHYKQHVGTALEEVISQIVEVNLIDHYLKTMENLKKENAKLFYLSRLNLIVWVIVGRMQN